MEKYLDQIFSYLVTVLQSTLNQLFILFGPLLILVLLLNLSAILTARLSVRFWGRNIFLYGFGWLGCSVHELSHAFFALIFGHKIKEITLFKPNGDGVSLGHVSHSYNKKSIYQKIGNFFIGIGPLLAAGIVLFLVILILYRSDLTKIYSFPISTQIFTDKQVLKAFIGALYAGLLSCRNLIVGGANLNVWKFVLLIYLLYSAGSSMTLSQSDVKGAISGFIWVVVFVLLFNLLTIWAGDFALHLLNKMVPYIAAFYFLLILVFGANLIFIILLSVLNLLKALLFYRK